MKVQKNDIENKYDGTYSSGQNKVPTAELKSRLIVVQKSFDSRSIAVL